MAAIAPGVPNGSYQKYMVESLKRFSRSIELCDDYLRGYYGLKLVSKSPLLPCVELTQQLTDTLIGLKETAQRRDQGDETSRRQRVCVTGHKHR